MGKGNQPSAPDPYQSAAAQYEYGTQAAAYNAALNRVNTQGPTSSTQFNVTGTDPQTGAPIYSESTQLNPQLQGLLNTSEAQAGQAQQTPLPDLGSLQNFGSQAREAAYKADTATMDPYWSQQQEQMDASLRNSGAQPGTPAYNNAMQAFQANRTAAYGQAENQAFGQGLTAQGDMISQIGQERSIPINEIQALTGGAQVSPAASATTSAPDIMQAFNNQYQGQLNSYNANVGSQNAALGDAAMLAAAYMMS